MYCALAQVASDSFFVLLASDLNVIKWQRARGEEINKTLIFVDHIIVNKNQHKSQLEKLFCRFFFRHKFEVEYKFQNITNGTAQMHDKRDIDERN